MRVLDYLDHGLDYDSRFGVRAKSAVQSVRGNAEPESPAAVTVHPNLTFTLEQVLLMLILLTLILKLD